MEESFYLQNSNRPTPIDQDLSLKLSRHTRQLIQDNTFKSIRMFSPRIIMAIIAFTPATLAAPKLEVKDVASDNTTCWYFLPNPSFLRACNLGCFEKTANKQ